MLWPARVMAHARVHHGEAWARDHFAAAERMREALNGALPTSAPRRDYQRVINAYRGVYYGAPTSTKADPSVVAVAETLVEMGRRFEDDKILNSAIAQYKFLRREYPGSKYRCDALFTIGEIYKDDLNDPEQARSFSGVSAPLSAQSTGGGCAAGHRGTGPTGVSREEGRKRSKKYRKEAAGKGQDNQTSRWPRMSMPSRQRRRSPSSSGQEVESVLQRPRSESCLA